MIGRYREYFRALKTRVSELKKQGKSQDEVASTLQKEMQAKYPDMAQPARVTQAAQIAYKEAL